MDYNWCSVYPRWKHLKLNDLPAHLFISRGNGDRKLSHCFSMELSKEEETNFNAVLKHAIKYAPFLRPWWGKQSCYFTFVLVKRKLDYLSFFSLYLVTFIETYEERETRGRKTYLIHRVTWLYCYQWKRRGDYSKRYWGMAAASALLNGSTYGHSFLW